MLCAQGPGHSALCTVTEHQGLGFTMLVPCSFRADFPNVIASEVSSLAATLLLSVHVAHPPVLGPCSGPILTPVIWKLQPPRVRGVVRLSPEPWSKERSLYIAGPQPPPQPRRPLRPGACCPLCSPDFYPRGPRNRRKKQLSSCPLTSTRIL